MEFGPNLIFCVLIILLTNFPVCVRKWSEKTHKFSGNVKKVSTGNFSGIFYLKKSGEISKKMGRGKGLFLWKNVSILSLIGHILTGLFRKKDKQTSLTLVHIKECVPQSKIHYMINHIWFTRFSCCIKKNHKCVITNVIFYMIFDFI